MKAVLVYSVWFGLPAAALVLGLSSRVPRWSAAVPPLILLAMGVATKVTEPPTYDMPWFGLLFYSFLALVAAVAATVGITIRWAIQRKRRGNRPARAEEEGRARPPMPPWMPP